MSGSVAGRFVVGVGNLMSDLGLNFFCVYSQRRIAREVDVGEVAEPIGNHPDEPADDLPEDQGRLRDGGVDADPQPGDVDALGDHVDGDDPLARASPEGFQFGRRFHVVASNDRRSLAGALTENIGDRVSVGDVDRDDKAAGVGVVFADLTSLRSASASIFGSPSGRPGFNDVRERRAASVRSKASTNVASLISPSAAQRSSPS